MNSKTTRQITSLVAAVTVSAVVARASGDTLGCWILGGEVKASAEYGVVANLTPGSPLTLVLDKTGSMSAKPKYVDYASERLPARSLYSDITMSTRLATLDQGILELSVNNPSTKNAKTDWINSHYLRIPEFGKELYGKDFTFEIITAQPKFNGSNGGTGAGRLYSTIVSISAPGNEEPGFRLTSYNHGTIYYKGNTAEQQLSNGWFTYLPTTGTKWFEDGWIWHHFAFVYTVANKTMKVIKDYTESTATLTMTADGANGLPMDASSFLQISGPLGTVTPCGTPEMRVAAVRVSTGALDYTGFMTLSKGDENFLNDSVVGWWRMENGTLGQALAISTDILKGQIPNEKKSAFASAETALRSESSYNGYWDGAKNAHEGVSAVFLASRKNRVGETESRDAAVSHSNALALASAQFVEPVNGLRLYVPRVPEVGIPGSFTCEAFVRKDLEVSKGGVAQTRALLMGMGGASWGVWDSVDFYLAFWYYKTIDGVVQEVERPQRTMAPQIPADHKWHHIAIVYDRPSPTSKKKLHLYYDYKETKGSPVEFAENEDLNWDSDGRLLFLGSKGKWGSDSWWGAGDELRFTRAVLTPDQFLHSFSDQGLTVVVR